MAGALTGRRIGEPVAELRLTQSLDDSVRRLVRPGPGRSMYVMSEVDAPVGRPDLAIVVIAPAVVDGYLRRGVRIPNVTAAKLLARTSVSHRGQATSEHEHRLKRDLDRAGWTPSMAIALAKAVHESLAVEAKIRDWRGGLRQVSRFRRVFERSALLLPSTAPLTGMEEALRAYGCGLLLEEGGRVRWRFEGTRNDPPRWAKLWTLELVARALESGSGYRVASRSNNSRASA